MSKQLKKITVEQLEEGIFVFGLDRPVCETPFPLQGFYIRSFTDITKLADYCRYVVIDTVRSRLASNNRWSIQLHSPDLGLSGQ